MGTLRLGFLLKFCVMKIYPELITYTQITPKKSVFNEVYMFGELLIGSRNLQDFCGAEKWSIWS